MRKIVISLSIAFGIVMCLGSLCFSKVEAMPVQEPVPQVVIEEKIEDKPALLSCESGTHRYTFTGTNGMEMEYLLYIPEGATENMPLIVSLHGGGETLKPHLVTENTAVIGEARKLNENRFIILQPCGDYAWHVKKQMDVVLETIDYIVDEYNINENRVILTGHSLGAIGVWYYGEHHADRWAAIVPVSNKPTIKFKELLETNIPVWAFWSTFDVGHNRTGMKEAVELLKSENPMRDVQYTVVQKVGHGDMSFVPYTQEFFDWAFKQTEVPVFLPNVEPT